MAGLSCPTFSLSACTQQDNAESMEHVLGAGHSKNMPCHSHSIRDYRKNYFSGLLSYYDIHLFLHLCFFSMSLAGVSPPNKEATEHSRELNSNNKEIKKGKKKECIGFLVI